MKCILNENDWCERHKIHHVGRLKEISQMEDEVGEKYRKLWDEMLAHPEMFKPEPINFSGCKKPINKPVNIWRITKKLKEIKNFIKALYNHVKNGFKKVNKQEYERRLNICSTCPFKAPKDGPLEQWKCTECGCWLKRKAKWAEQNCPKGYWDQTNKPTGGCGCSK